MSVYRPKGKDGSPRTPYYHFDFQLKPVGSVRSQRFCGSTGQKAQAAADRVEAQMRELAALGRLGHIMTMREATERYMREVGNRARGNDGGKHARRQQELCMTELITYYGEETPIMAITPDHVAKAVAVRAETQCVRWRMLDGELLPLPTGKLPSPSTVNRQVVEPLRRVLRRSRKHWKIPIDLEQFQWGGRDGVMLDEPAERNRELTAAEESRFWDVLHEEYHDICELYIISGKRQSNWLKVPKFKVDLENGTVKMRKLKKRSGEEEIIVQLTDRELEIVTEAYLADPHSEYLFNASSQSPRDRGRRTPITTRMLYDNVTRAFKAAHITDIRPHDFRHTFGSRALRNDPNLKKLMGAMDHSSIRSTLRYINVLQDEVRNMRAGVKVTKSLPGNVTRISKGKN